MIDPRTPHDELGEIARRMSNLQDQIDALKAPSGTSAFQTVSKLQALINDIQAQLDAYMVGKYTNAQIDEMRNSSPGGFTVNGALEVNGSLHADGGITTDGLFVSPAAFTTLVGVTRAALWVDDTGRIGRT